MIPASEANGSGRKTVGWSRLAAVARQRASEQSELALVAPDADAAAPHLEQHAHLLGLAEAYDARAQGWGERRLTDGSHGPTATFVHAPRS